MAGNGAAPPFSHLTMPASALPSLNRRQTLLLLVGAVCVEARSSPGGFWPLLRQGGCVVLVCHAQTEPGTGDPPGFALGRCDTQRNLSAAGRTQARRMGEAFQREDIAIASVRSSAWCRCADTARLAFGRYTVWPALNPSLPGPPDHGAQAREVLDTVAGLRAPVNWVLVTHPANIAVLTGEPPAMGELFLARPGPAVPGRLQLLARQRV